MQYMGQIAEVCDQVGVQGMHAESAVNALKQPENMQSEGHMCR